MNQPGYSFIETQLKKFETIAQDDPKKIRLDELKACAPFIKKLFLSKNTIHFEKALNLLPKQTSNIHLNQDCITIGLESELTPENKKNLKEGLRLLMPWRKGPFNLFGQQIDSEWQSFYKWNRITPFLPDLNGKNVLDIGCNNGYYLFRLLAKNPKLLLGIDPLLIYFYQFYAIDRYIHAKNLNFLPLGMEHLAMFKEFFDVVFCMGILYHRASPIESLKTIKNTLMPNGHLILETITYPGEDSLAFSPEERYGKMPNIYFIPTVTCLVNWLKRVGFKKNQIISTTITTHEEQRKTEWMTFESLADYLNVSDSSKTIEGYPAPRRTIIISSN